MRARMASVSAPKSTNFIGQSFRTLGPNRISLEPASNPSGQQCLLFWIPLCSAGKSRLVSAIKAITGSRAERRRVRSSNARAWSNRPCRLKGKVPTVAGDYLFDALRHFGRPKRFVRTFSARKALSKALSAQRFAPAPIRRGGI